MIADNGEVDSPLTRAEVPIELAWRAFVRSVDGKVIEDLVPEPRTFQNADFLFPSADVVAELKVIETEFSESVGFWTEFTRLMERVVREDPDWRPILFGGSGNVPAWFPREYARLARKPLSRILKKANRQLRETKAHFEISSPTGVLFLVNERFASVHPPVLISLVSDLLMQSYSSIDCCVHLKINQPAKLDEEATCVLWVPTYSDRAPDSLSTFVDGLGRRWFNYLEQIAGPFDWRSETDDHNFVLRTRSREPD